MHRKILVALLLGSLWSANCGDSDMGIYTAVASQVVVYHGGVQPGWAVHSFGASVAQASTALRRPGSPASLSTVAQPYASLEIVTTEPFEASGVLDLWLTGSALTQAELSLADSASLRATRPLPLALAAASGNVSRLLGPAADGWYRLQVNLQELTLNTAVPAEGQTDAWDRIVFADASGRGFALLLDDTSIVPHTAQPSASPPGSQDVTAACVGAACNPMLDAASAASDLVPLYGVGAGVAAVGPDELIARLAPNVTVGELARLCGELAGALPPGRQQRFRGACKLGSPSGAVQDMGAVVEWPYVTVGVKTPEDVRAMQSALKGKVTFFERNRQASILPGVPSGAAPREAAGPPAAKHPGTNLPRGDFSTTCNVVWGLDRIDQPSLLLDGNFNPGNLTGAGVHVYMLDTGLRTTHSDFAGRVGEGANCLRGCQTGGTVADDNGHGTHTAGTAVGTCFGVAKAATIHPVKVFDSSGQGDFDKIVGGMGWVRSHVQKNGNWRAVVSMSLGGPSSPAVNQAVADLVAAGIPVVAAAGNEYGADACSTSPGGAPAAITVGSTDRDDQVSSFSNLGRCLDIFAPGGRITSAGWSSDTATKIMSGTSMATPHVAGAVALALQVNPGATPQQVSDTLARTAAQLAALGSSGSVNRFVQATQKLAP